MRGTAIRLCAVIWLFGYALVVASAAAEGRFAGGMILFASLPLLMLGIVQSVALSLLLDQLEERPGNVRWLAMIGAVLTATLLQTVADQAWIRLLALTLVPVWQAWAIDPEPQRLVMLAGFYCWTTLLSITLVWATRASDRAQLNEARAAAFAAVASRAEAAALRLQLNPHFLFNTLNGISSLVVRGHDEQAEEMLGRLADFLRASLVSHPDAMVPIEQELGTIQAYLDIERARFGERLEVEIDIDPALADLRVPNFLLQPLVENAVKHGVEHVASASRIAITVREETGTARIRLHNTLGPGAPNKGHGIGIANSRQRLGLHYGDAAKLEHGPAGDDYAVAITLPLPGARAIRAVGDGM